MVPPTRNTRQPGQGDIQNVAADLDVRLKRMVCEYQLRVMRLQDKILRVNGTQRLDDAWAHVRGIEQQFNLVQGEYELRISQMQADTAQCKSQAETLGIFLYSSDTIGGSSSATRY